MTPTGRNRLFDLMMQGTQAAGRGEQPEQTGYMLPAARYQNGGVLPAVPGAVTDAMDWMSSGMNQDPQQFNSASPEQRQSYDHQNIMDAMMVAGAAGTGSLAATRPANSLGIFGGRLAKTADQQALARAEAMAADGAPHEQVWNETGWFQGPDQKWRFEIDDSQAQFTVPQQEKFVLKDEPISGSGAFVFRHPDMWKAYPENANQQVHISPGKSGFEGSYDGNKIYGSAASTGQARELMLHESQHAVQNSENFARGANDSYGHPIDQVKAAAKEVYEARQQTYNPNHPDEILLRDLGMEKDLSRPWEDMTDRQRMEWWDAGRSRLYRKSAGETEARAVQARKDLTPEQRRARAPWLDYDVPEADQIVRFK